MPAAETAERPNTVTIADAGPSRKKLTIEVPAETVSEKLRESLDTLAEEAQIPGFRRGRAPRGLVEKRFGTAVRDEARKQLVASAYAKALEDSKLKVVGDPIADKLDQLQVQEGRPLAFEVEVEVMPEFALPSLEGIAVRKPLLEITDQMVEEQLRRVLINEGKLEPREAPEPGDYLTGRGIMKGPDGQEFYNIPGAVVQVPTPDKGGKGMVLGILVEDFEKQLGLPRTGQTATIHATGPENHEIEGVRNARLVITFAVERVDRIIPAEVATLVGKHGLESEAQLRDVIRTRLEQRVLVQQQEAMRSQVARHLLEATAMELPARLTSQQAARALERQRMELMYRGVDPQTIEERIAELRAASAQVAAGELKLFFILNRAAEDLGVKVTEEEINGRIAQLAFDQNKRPEALRQELIQRNQVGQVYAQIREHKTFDAILAKATITEVSADEFTKAAQPPARATAGAAEAEPSAPPAKPKAPKSKPKKGQ